jgi:transcriptional regulator with XRE-family HTH domain
LRKVRTLLAECMEGPPPPICARIRETRERLKQEAQEQGGRGAATEYSQEQVAHRVGVSLKAYRAYETSREPNYQRRQAIARALGLSDDYFETERPEDDRLRQIVQEELGEVREAVERIEELLEGRARRRRERA